MAVEGEEHRNLAEVRVRRIGRVVELHTVLAAGHRMAVAGVRRRAVVEELHMVVGEGHRKAVVAAGSLLVVVGIALEAELRKAVVEDSLAEEGIDLEEEHRKAVEEGSLAEGEDIGHSLAAGNGQAAERRMEVDNHLDCMP